MTIIYYVVCMYIHYYINKCTGFEQAFEGSNLQMLSATFKCLYFIT